MATIIAKIQLSSTYSSWQDRTNGIYLTIKNPKADILSDMQLDNIKNAVRQKILMITAGYIDLNFYNPRYNDSKKVLLDNTWENNLLIISPDGNAINGIQIGDKEYEFKGDLIEPGPVGPQGIQGAKGDKGDKGEPGAASISINDIVTNTEQTWTSDKISKLVKLNDKATSVNFIENKVVQDGLVKANDLFNYDNSTLLFSIVSPSTTQTTDIKIIENLLTLTNGFKLYFAANGKLVFQYISSSTNTNVYAVLETTYKNGIVYNFKLQFTGNIVKIGFGGAVHEVSVVKNTVSNISLNSKLRYFIGYNRLLTSQEIQHNFSALNNAPSVSSLETTDSNFLFATDSDHVTDRTGRVQEQINRVFYKNMCKEFTGTGEDIVVNNGLDGYVLNGKIEGQTVKSYADITTPYVGVAGGNSLSLFTIAYGNNKVKIQANSDVTLVDYFLATLGKNIQKYLKYETKYDVVLKITEKITTKQSHHMYIIRSDASNAVTASYPITWYNTGAYTKVLNVTTRNDYDISKGTPLYFRLPLIWKENDYLEIELLAVVDTGLGNTITKQIPFGLNSTQATITNNGLKYSFYANAEDKAQGKVLDLGGLEGARNTLEIKEDGSAVCTQNTLQEVFDGSDDEGWALNGYSSNFVDTVMFDIPFHNLILKKDTSYVLLCDKITSLTYNHRLTDRELICNTESTTVGKSSVRINITKTKLSSQDKVGFKTWLQANPITVRYQLATPIVTHIPNELVPAILTQLTNKFSFGDAVKATSAEIIVPVDKVSDLETKLNNLNSLVVSLQLQLDTYKNQL